MQVGDIVLREVYGENLQFCILGFYTDSQKEEMAVLAFLDLSLISEARISELTPLSLKSLFSLKQGSGQWH